MNKKIITLLVFTVLANQIQGAERSQQPKIPKSYVSCPEHYNQACGCGDSEEEEDARESIDPAFIVPDQSHIPDPKEDTEFSQKNNPCQFSSLYLQKIKIKLSHELCLICRDALNNDYPIRPYSCSHMHWFHIECLDLRTPPKEVGCPICFFETIPEYPTGQFRYAQHLLVSTNSEEAAEEIEQIISNQILQQQEIGRREQEEVYIRERREQEELERRERREQEELERREQEELERRARRLQERLDRKQIAQYQLHQQQMQAEKRRQLFLSILAGACIGAGLAIYKSLKK